MRLTNTELEAKTFQNLSIELDDEYMDMDFLFKKRI